VTEQKLYAVAAPQEAEAPSAWLARVAAGQAESLRELAKFLGFDMYRDFDIQFLKMVPADLAKVCGLPETALSVPYRMLGNLSLLRMASPALRWKGKRALYRFCPLCLKDQRTPYFPFHWRLEAYRVCHIHDCFLEDECAHCKTNIIPQHDWMRAGPKREGIGMASMCRKCGKLLWKVDPLFLHSCFEVTPLERAQLVNGRAFAAALLFGKVQIPFSSVTDLRLGIRCLEKAFFLCQGSDLTVGSLRKLQSMDPVDVIKEHFGQIGHPHVRYQQPVGGGPFLDWLHTWRGTHELKAQNRRKAKALYLDGGVTGNAPKFLSHNIS
jgi:hypothetical protein